MKQPATKDCEPGISLNEEEIERLMQPEADPELHYELTQKITHNYGGKLAAKESIAAEQIFRLLVRDTELKVRALLADKLKSSKSLPRDIAFSMAKDTADEVALPMLRYSEVLEDTDLISVMDQNNRLNRQLAISSRDEVSEEVSEKLISRGEEEVALSLTRNAGARISKESMEHVVDRFAQSREIMDALAYRPGLPTMVAERVVSLVSQNVAEGLQQRYGIKPKSLIYSESERVREDSVLELLQHAQTPYEITKLIEQMITFKRLTSSLMLMALAHGYLKFFEISIAKRAGVKPENAAKLLKDRGNLGFRALYNKSGLPSELFMSVRTLTTVVEDIAFNSEQRFARGTAFFHEVENALERLNAEAPIENFDQLLKTIGSGED